MKRLAVLAILVFVSASAFASKPCDELKGEIAKKLDDKGVKGYSLDIIDAKQDSDAKVVGTCEGGTKKIVYSREAAAPAKTADKAAPTEKKK